MTIHTDQVASVPSTTAALGDSESITETQLYALSLTLYLGAMFRRFLKFLAWVSGPPHCDRCTPENPCADCLIDWAIR
jgi:hypothetical protein